MKKIQCPCIQWNGCVTEHECLLYRTAVQLHLVSGQLYASWGNSVSKGLILRWVTDLWHMLHKAKEEMKWLKIKNKLLRNWVLTLRGIHRSTETKRKYVQVKHKCTRLQKKCIVSSLFVGFLDLPSNFPLVNPGVWTESIVLFTQTSRQQHKHRRLSWPHTPWPAVQTDSSVTVTNSFFTLKKWKVQLFVALNVRPF